MSAPMTTSVLCLVPSMASAGALTHPEAHIMYVSFKESYFQENNYMNGSLAFPKRQDYDTVSSCQSVMEDLLGSVWKGIPQWWSRDIKQTERFYRDHLGFKIEGLHPDEENPIFLSVSCGPKVAVNIYFHLWGEEKGQFHRSEIYIAVGTTQLDQMWELLSKNDQVEVMYPVKDETWGFRQFTINDPDKNRVTFFRFLEGGNPGDV